MSKNPPKTRSIRARPSASAKQLMENYAEALPAPVDELDLNTVWGNADVLVHQWRRELGDEGSEAVLLGVRIRRIGMLLDEITMAHSEAEGVKHTDFLLLMALRRLGDPYAMRPTDILKMHSVTSGTATYRIDQLAKQDLAERLPDPRDRRGYLVRLTPRGKQIVDRVMARMQAEFNARLAPFAKIAGGHDVLEAGLRLFELCIEPGATAGGGSAGAGDAAARPSPRRRSAA
jgi:DNA-binding MarR family transcriptional regulator